MKNSIIVILTLLYCVSSSPITKITNHRILKLIAQIFYTPPSGEPYFNASSEALPISTICNEVCVPFHLCVNGSVLTSGANLLTPRFGVDDDEPQHCIETEMCCKLSYDDDDENGPINSNVELESKNVTDKTNKPNGSNNVEYVDNEENWKQMCGIRNSNGLYPRISQDDRADFSEFPWMVMVLRKMPRSEYFDYQCGGSLIHPSIVLTAAHCVHKIRPHFLHIRAGEWDMAKTEEISPHQDREIQSIVIHPNYYKPTLLNDIALLILKTPVQLAENVNTICLPPADYSFNNERCVVSGWGKKNRSRASRFQTILKKIELPIVPNNQCQKLFRKTVLGKYFRLDSSFICAGGEYGKDVCKGDGGSPLVCRIPDTMNAYYQSGIVSWGIGCSSRNVPGAYVNVARYRNWIDAEMQKIKLERNYYIHDDRHMN